MEAPVQKLSVGEMKFRAMVEDLMVMETPSMVVATSSSSKARSLRRSFYNWIARLAEMERNFMSTLEFKLVGRHIYVARKESWYPKEIPNATPSQSQSS